MEIAVSTGSSRRDAVRYDTPTWQGFTASVSYGENVYWDAALRYGGEFAGFRVASAVGYRRIEDQEADSLNAANTAAIADTRRDMVLGSGSILHLASGLFVNGAFYKYEYKGTNVGEVISGTTVNRPDTMFWYVAGGISQNWLGIGKTALYGEYGKTSDGITGRTAATQIAGLGATGVIIDSEMRYWGVGVVQNIDSAAMELYVAYRKYSADVTTDAAQITGGLMDIDFVQAGARIQF